jgi:hypothetical protein
MILETLVPDDEYRPDAYHPSGVMNEVFHLAAELPPSSIVAFHGWPGSGKSPSARWLGRQLRCRVIHLDNFRKLQPDGSRRNFDESAMRDAIDRARAEKLIVVDGVCACRVCEPTILVTFGDWPAQSLTDSLKSFIGDYNPENHNGTEATFTAVFRSYP